MGVPAARMGQVLKDKYLLEEVLGSGGMGEVYRARNTLMDRVVAIKVLHPQHAKNKHIVERFMREAKAANVVRHKNIVDVLDIDRDDSGALFIVQEYLEGNDLAHHLQSSGGKLAPREALELMIPVTRAVGEAHRRGVVHRDLKPDNIFLAHHDGEIVPKVLDFGISKLPLVGAEAERPSLVGPAPAGGARLTAAGAAMGTPAYMSPEQIRDPASVDARTDVWSIGVMVYELLSGSVPFHAEDLAALFAVICTHDPPPLERVAPGVPRALSRLVQRCLRPDRDARFESASELAAALERCLEGLAQPHGSAEPAAPRPAGAAADSDTRAAEPTGAALVPAGAEAVATAVAPPFATDAVNPTGDTLVGSPEPVEEGGAGEGPPPAIELDLDPPLALEVAAASLPDRSPRRSPGARPRAAAAFEPDATTASDLVRAALAAALVGVVVLAVPNLPPSRIAVLYERIGAYTFVPYLAVGIAIVVAGLVVMWRASRRVSFVLFGASLGALVTGAAALVAGIVLAVPGAIPDLARTLLLLAAPWGGVALAAGLCLHGLLCARERYAEGTSGVAIALVAGALLGAGAAVYLAGAPRATVDEVTAIRLLPAADRTEHQASRFAVLIAGAEALRREPQASIGRSTSGGETAGGAVGPVD